ncbi:MAG TPA: ATP cone domain-containing protein, partial [Thermomicrobiales bacterium]|nr:ATP cone domain-containing protein [Thermomicrobiales bacterium]
MVKAWEQSNNGARETGADSARFVRRLVRKRDGRTAPFDRSRISHAVEMAVRAELGRPFPDPIAAAAARQVEAIVDAVLATLPT